MIQHIFHTRKPFLPTHLFIKNTHLTHTPTLFFLLPLYSSSKYTRLHTATSKFLEEIHSHSHWNQSRHLHVTFITSTHHFWSSAESGIFYKVGQTWLTQTKCDLDDPNNPDDSTWFQPWWGQVIPLIDPKVIPHTLNKCEWISFVDANHTLCLLTTDVASK